jgi:hypothetical protein
MGWFRHLRSNNKKSVAVVVIDKASAVMRSIARQRLVRCLFENG